MKDLEDYRREIDELDRKLVALLEQRMGIAERIGEAKRSRRLPIRNEAREAEVYQKWVESLHQPELAPYLKEIFESLMATSCAYQEKALGEKEKKDAVFMGVPGSNGEAAALSFFSADRIYGVDSFERVVDAVKNGLVSYGLLPIENSTSGSVADVFDLLVSGNLSIVGETYVEVCHALLGIRGASEADVCEVYSHEQAFSQCKEYLGKHPEWIKIPYYNTAISAKFVSESGDRRKAAIASPRAAEIYQLDILNRYINTGQKNVTRFLLVSADPAVEEGANKISLAFVLPHVSGSLSRALEIFQQNGINLLKIESRPIIDEMGEYRFFIDFEGNLNEQNTARALEELKAVSRSLVVFGNYPKGD